ncbi:hypothetical protein QZH41_016124 [Actinostola sp. cb2023]|nr:hypothetical protein QZH41_016124 [Actinostola sp. cb2023]
MRDVRLLRECLDGKIPPITTNDTEQLGLLIAKFMETKGVKADDNTELFQDISQDNYIDLSPVKGKEELPFTKFVPIAQLEKRHGINLGQTYMNDHACTEFIDSIAEVYEQELNEVLHNGVHYYSILVDGSTDASNKEKELIFILYVDPDTGKQRMRVFFHLEKWNVQLLQEY